MAIYEMPNLTSASGADGSAANASTLGIASGFDSVTGSMTFTTVGGKKAIGTAVGSQVIQRTGLSTRYIKQRMLVWFTALWSGGDLYLIGTYHSGGGAYGSRGMVTAASDLRLQAPAHTTVTQATDDGDHPVGAWVLIELWTDAGTTTANTGQMHMRAYLDSDKSQIFDSTLRSALNVSAGSGVLSTARFIANPITAIRDLAYATDADATSMGDPWWPAGDASAGPDQTGVEPGRTVTLNGTGTGTWTQTGGTPTVVLGGSGATRTFEAPYTNNGTTLTFSYGADTMTVGVLRATRFLVTAGGPTPTLVPLKTVLV